MTDTAPALGQDSSGIISLNNGSEYIQDSTFTPLKGNISESVDSQEHNGVDKASDYNNSDIAAPRQNDDMEMPNTMAVSNAVSAAGTTNNINATVETIRGAADSEAERLRLRAKYNERLKERTVQIYRRALEGVIEEEKRCSTLRITFICEFSSQFGQNLFLIGSEPFLGGWNCDKAMPLSWHSGGHWKCTVSVPSACNRVQYKYIIKEGGHVTWEMGPNRILDTRELAKTAGVLNTKPNGNTLADAAAATGAAAAGQSTRGTAAAVCATRMAPPIDIHDTWGKQ